MESKIEMITLGFLVIVFLLTFSRGDDFEGKKELMSRTLPAFTLTGYAEILNGTGCQTELTIFRKAINERKLWSLKMLDSSGEPRPGFIYGNNYWLGVQSQCLDSTNVSPLILNEEVKLNNSKFRNVKEEFPPFDVNYFVAYFRHNSTLQYHIQLPNEDLITLGLCLPAKCSTNEIGFILDKIFQERTLVISDLYKADFQLVKVKDMYNDGLFLNGRRIFILACLSFILVLMIIGTLYDAIVHQKHLKLKEKLAHFENNNITNNNDSKYMSQSLESAVLKYHQSIFGKIILCFSMYTNTKIILNTKVDSGGILAIHGLRFLGMLWIIMIHTIFYAKDFTTNKAGVWRLSEGIAQQVLANSTLSVDTFFFLSGFLISHLYWKGKKNEKKEKSFNFRPKVNEFFGAVLKRFVRLTPAYMMILGIAELNFGWYEQVSQFYMSERPQEVCTKYWWRNLLYINNLFGRDTMCLSWSWYLSNDMQFFIITTFLLILSSICFYTAFSILISLLIGSIGITSYLSYIYGYVPTLDAQYAFLDILYDPPWTRIGPYIVGVITGYILLKLNNELHLRTRTVALCWFLGSSCNLVALFSIWERYMSVTSAAFYVGLCRSIWALGLSWLLIACCTNHGGIVNQILSFKGWIPLSRLTYCAYLLNPFIINSLFLHSEAAQHVDFLPIGTTFLGVFATTYLCSYAFSLMMETPVVLLMRLAFAGKRNS